METIIFIYKNSSLFLQNIINISVISIIQFPSLKNETCFSPKEFERKCLIINQ